MTKVFFGFIFALCVSFDISPKNNGIYYIELKKLKKAPATKIIFDENAHQGLSQIQRDIIMCKNLSLLERFTHSLFLVLDVVVVNAETMPLLYNYVHQICQNADIATPTIFITRNDGFFNAAAQKLLMSTGAIIIGQKLIHELSDDSLEAVIAHEIGHVKYNHVNKIFGLFLVSLGVYNKMCPLVVFEDDSNIMKLAKCYAIWKALSLLRSYLIGKRFEEEADEFAYRNNHKAAGLIEFFELLLKKEDIREQEFIMTQEVLRNNKENLSTSDYYSLLLSFYMAKFGHECIKQYKNIYHNTFLGAHPSPEARIRAASKYL